jgi:hypothetical protein
MDLSADEKSIEHEVPEITPQKSWVGSICSYFRDFLDTDFQRARAPKRSIVSRDSYSNLTGIALSRYPELGNDLWQLLADPLGSSLSASIAVRRGKYRSRMNKSVADVIQKHIEGFADEDIHRVVFDLKAVARSGREKFKDDPERLASELSGQLKTALLVSVVNPLLGALDTVFSQQSANSIEGIFDLEEELGAQLTTEFSENISSSVASAIVENDFTDLDQLIEDACAPDRVKICFLTYFESFATSDFFNELSELRSTLKVKDNFQIYIYCCALRYGSSSYPLFYFPVEVKLADSVFTISTDPHLLVNKKAIDFAVTEISRASSQPIPFTVPERIIYLSDGDSFLQKMQNLLDEFTTALAVKGAIDLHESRQQKVSRSDISVDNSLYFAAFDTADESLLNDFEDLLSNLLSDSPEAEDFKQMVSGFMESNPVSFDEQVDVEWRATELPERLVYDSPIPLNEEQRKILSALNKRDCRFIAVEGPPGTGKSHTITACVFDMILRGKNVLILSDKAEALDVAENKIRQTLQRVRIDETLQDPILRLGKQGSSYTKILSTKTITQLKQSVQVARDGERELTENIEKCTDTLKGKIERLKAADTAIEIDKIISVQKNERKFENIAEDPEELFRQEAFVVGLKHATELSNILHDEEVDRLIRRTGSSMCFEELERDLTELEKMSKVVDSMGAVPDTKMFGRFKPQQLTELTRLIDRFEDARMPVFGYLFAGSKLSSINRELRDNFDINLPKLTPPMLGGLFQAQSSFRELRSRLEAAEVVDKKIVELAFECLISDQRSVTKNLAQAKRELEGLFYVMHRDEFGGMERLGIYEDDLSGLSRDAGGEVKQQLVEASDHSKNIQILSEAFHAAPIFDYASDVRDLEDLHAQRLANTLDERVVTFANEKRNKAQQIKDVIKRKQMFPKDLFDELRTAFPVMIAGIRDYAEYVPLEKGLFDLIIIDEASQVSIAQALPAFIRAEQILVLGDRNQFSNVKTERASKVINQTYKGQIVEQFRSEENPDISQLNQIKMFDIKTSVLDFVERIANLKIMLRKHFRGYPELIRFSSKYFYSNQLQAVKIRGKPIEEVISFVPVEMPDEKVELVQKTNSVEAKAIVRRLEELNAEDNPVDCCVITPHTEQQKLILREVSALPNGRDLMERLHLKVFTFDTCQGEERDTILYSMVASPNEDRLNYVFPKDLEGSDEVEESLRLQRLNVGFSRAKERIEIFHSKPIDQYKGSIYTALQHFRNTLNNSFAAPSTADVDPSSPMEAKVLGWLQQVPILGELGDQVEVDAQFELGAYLRQLDPSYDHPNYKVDFLIKVVGETSAIQIIVEYDGFKEHFTDLEEVDASNYEHYMKPADVERQKILEGYGYKFLRINRFNIGDDPVLTLDERLRNLIKAIDVERQPPSLIEKYQQQQADLEAGDSKVCSRCEKVKPVEDFFDASLKGGDGGYGRICTTCKGPKASSKKRRSRKRSSTRTKVSADGSREGATYLNCPYSDKEECKKLGGRWDPFRKKWYVPSGVEISRFSKWL